MRKGLVGIAVFLAAFFFGTAIASLKQPEAAPSVGASVNAVWEPEPEKPAVAENDVSEKSYGGWYDLDEYTGMNEVNGIAISNSFGDDKGGGGVFTTFEKYGDRGFVEDAWIKIDANHVMFRTKKINGIRYRFEGTFCSADWSDHERAKPLYGTLQKFVKGKKVAEVSGNFKYIEPMCTS